MSDVTFSFQLESDLPAGELELLLKEASESVSRTLMGYIGADGKQVYAISPMDVQTGEVSSGDDSPPEDVSPDA